MNNIFKYQCATCHKIHEGSPSFSFKSPTLFNVKRGFIKSFFQKKYLTSDFCSVGNNYFIRAVLEIPIIGIKKPFMLGVWVSQSKENYKYYLEHFHIDLEGRQTFGWFSNVLPYYENTLGQKTRVLFRNNNQRPLIHIEETEHELSHDFHKGILIDKAKRIAEIVMHYVN